jgi:hypothetical protein
MHIERVDPRDRLSPPGTRLFDVVDDPNEQTNLAFNQPENVARLLRPILARLKELRSAATERSFAPPAFQGTRNS